MLRLSERSATIRRHRRKLAALVVAPAVLVFGCSGSEGAAPQTGESHEEDGPIRTRTIVTEAPDGTRTVRVIDLATMRELPAAPGEEAASAGSVKTENCQPPTCVPPPPTCDQSGLVIWDQPSGWNNTSANELCLPQTGGYLLTQYCRTWFRWAGFRYCNSYWYDTSGSGTHVESFASGYNYACWPGSVTGQGDWYGPNAHVGSTVGSVLRSETMVSETSYSPADYCGTAH
jgi:hypothetical protein